MSRGLLSFFTENPRIAEEHKRFYAFSNFGYAGAGIAHVVYLIVFYFLDAHILTIFNIFSCIVFPACIYLNKRNKMNLSLLLAATELTAHSFVATYCIGFQSCFFVVFTAACVLIMISSSFSLTKKLLMASVPGSALLVVYLMTYNVEPVYLVSDLTIRIFGSSNMAFVMTVLCYVVYLYYNLTTKLNKDLRNTVADLNLSNGQLLEAKDALWGEMELAKKIQTVLLPAKPKIAGFEIATFMRPADEVGGDYYDVINTENEDWIVIGDVSGHGVSAGLVMMMAQVAINTALQERPDSSPKDILRIMNSVITQNVAKLGDNKYMTITVMSRREEGKFLYTGAHQDIFVYRAATKNIERVETVGMWLGLIQEIGDMIQVDQLNIDPGDVMLLYTDGITEARNSNKDMFSSSRLANTFLELGEKAVEDIKNGLLGAIDGYTADDDISFVILKRC